MSETAAAAAPRFSVRSVQLARAGFAALAALMITFSSDHSAELGLSVFSGFAMATALIFLLSAWLTYPAGRRWAPIALGVIALLAGMASGIPAWRTTLMLFVILIAWGAISGLVELLWGLRERKRLDVPKADSRDAMTGGIVGIALAIAVAVVPAQYTLTYFIPEADREFVLTGTIIAVGLFGVYAAIMAVLTGIAGFSPRAPLAKATSAEKELA